MSTNFPATAIDSYTTKSDGLGNKIYAAYINDPQDAIVAIETKLGINSSGVTSTIDYILKSGSSVDPGHLHTTAGISGAIAIGKGGTNITTYTTGDLPYASNTDVLSKLAIGTGGEFLVVSGGLPDWSNTLTVNTAGDAFVVNQQGAGSSIDIQDGGTSVFEINNGISGGGTPTILFNTSKYRGGVRIKSVDAIDSNDNYLGNLYKIFDIQNNSGTSLFNVNHQWSGDSTAAFGTRYLSFPSTSYLTGSGVALACGTASSMNAYLFWGKSVNSGWANSFQFSLGVSGDKQGLLEITAPSSVVMSRWFPTASGAAPDSFVHIHDYVTRIHEVNHATHGLSIYQAGAGNVLSLNSGTFGSPTNAFKVSKTGLVTVPTTITAVGTTGNQTINKPTGTVNIAAAGTSVVVTNSLVTANSIVIAVPSTNDTTAKIKSIVPAAGSFTINTDAVTAETAFSFLVIN